MLHKIFRFLFEKNVTKFARLQTLKVTQMRIKNNKGAGEEDNFYLSISCSL